MRPGDPPSRRLGVGSGVELAVHDDPHDPRPPLVVAHGAGSSAWFVIEAFADAVEHDGWRLVTYDLRGHGASTPLPNPGDHALAHHVADLAQVLADTGARAVAGVSLGGLAAVQLATSADTGGLLAVGAVLPPWSGGARAGEGPHAAIAAEVRAAGVAGLRARIAADAGMPRWLRDVVTRDYARHDADSLRAALLALDGADAPTLEAIAALRMPLATVGWPDDPGHPLHVAATWAQHAPAGTHATTTIAAVGADRSALGRALTRALHGASPRAAGLH